MNNILQYLEEQIAQLKLELSVHIPEEMKDAIEAGDLKENTEYSSALERQHLAGVRLEQLLRRLDAYKKIDITLLPKDAINIGSTVKVRNLKTNKIEYFKVVLSEIDDADDIYQQVTISSPIGQSLKNKKVKDEVEVLTPSGKVLYRVLQIRTAHSI